MGKNSKPEWCIVKMSSKTVPISFPESRYCKLVSTVGEMKLDLYFLGNNNL